jgi:regulator of RNase E activity RraB
LSGAALLFDGFGKLFETCEVDDDDDDDDDRLPVAWNSD